mgnify:FL=1
MDIGLREIVIYAIPALLAIVDILIWCGFFKSLAKSADKIGDTIKELALFLSQTLGHSRAKYASLIVSLIYLCALVLLC